MLRTSLIVLTACATPARQVAPAKHPPRAAAEAAAPDVVYVADLIQRRVSVGPAIPAGITLSGPRRLNSLHEFVAKTDGFRTLGPTFVPVTQLGPTLVPLAPHASTARVDYCIDGTGQVTSANASGLNPMFNRLALEAVRGWHFAPCFVHNKPVTACSSVAITQADLTREPIIAAERPIQIETPQ